MASTCTNKFLNTLAGTSQSQRQREALDPATKKLHDLSTTDHLKLTRDFAQYINYFKTADAENPSGTWQKFFPEGDTIKLEAFITSAKKYQEITPHLCLFITFLKLLEKTQERFNTLTERHLDFYYGQILQIQKNRSKQDQVHLIFELAKHVEHFELIAGTEALAGKDADNKPLTYATDHTTILNKAQVSGLKSLYKDADASVFKYAAKTNTIDGLEQELKEDNYWLPFGYPNTFKNRPALPAAILGFALEAPVLKMQEGLRQVAITYEMDSNEGILATDLIENIDVFITGEKKWIGPLRLQNTSVYTHYITQVTASALKLAFSITESEKAIVNYDSNLHEGGFNASAPIVKFVIQIDNEKSYKLAEALSKINLKDVTVQVAVDGIQKLNLKNDTGVINAEKPFFPFGPRPFKNTKFTIDYPELFEKRWQQINLQLNWLNLPEDFKNHYDAYRTLANTAVNSTTKYLKSIYKIEGAGDSRSITYDDSLDNRLVTGADHFTVNIELENESGLLDNSEYEIAKYPLFNSDASDVATESRIALKSIADQGVAPAAGPLELRLNNGFYHDRYASLYSLAIASMEEDVMIPNEPYTPFLDRLTLSYEASQKLDFQVNSQTTKDVAQLNLLHLHPFGVDKATRLFPSYNTGGYLYIGLTEAQPKQQISMLFEIQEGTENPLKDSFLKEEGIQWSVLTNTGWELLSSDAITRDETQNFLKTGIISILLPERASTTHTQMPPGQIWLMAYCSKDFDAVCRMVNIHTQAVQATLTQTDATIYTKGIPAETISKLSQRLYEVKKIKQPYSGFNGAAEESQSDYYSRVSERLRHKDHAVSLWDYEHLLLQNFKQLYKVKCLNHTCKNKFKAPGHVTLVVIPDTINQQVFDVFEPRVSTALLNEIQAFISARTSFFITPKIINPEYEPVSVSLNVQFKKGLDAQFYLGKLQEDIKKWLSPWAYEQTSKIIFGVSIQKSMLIHHLEQQDYIDYLTDVILNHLDSEKNLVSPSSPKAILVSAKKHQIALIAQNTTASSSQTSVLC